MDAEFQDLVPLYLTESKRRLEHLLELAPRSDSPTVANEARRELHTLKGSSRMLQIKPVAELCHRGESLLQESNEATPAKLTELLDELSQLLADLARGQDRQGEEDDEKEEAPGEAGEHRISVETADRLTASTASMRLLTLSALSSSTRVDELAQLAEGAIGDPEPEQVLAMLASHLRQVASDLEMNLHRLMQHSEGQLKRLLDVQLQPLRPFLQNLARHARELARTLGKEVEIEVVGGEARLDQRIAAEVQNAFLHLVRNAVDHGIETPEEREELGKDRAGRVEIAATSFGDRIEVVVMDDGAGIDPARVLEAGREAGLVSADAGDLSDLEVLQLLFSTGFSTRRHVSEVSGRGVGLDAVASAVRQLGGDVWIDSKPREGSSVYVTIPAARRGERVLILRSGFDRLALPRSSVRWIRGTLHEELIVSENALMVDVDGELLRVISLADLVGASEATAQPVLIALQVAGTCRVLAVDAVEGDAEVLVRPMRQNGHASGYYSGIALLPSGEPVAVLSPRSLVGFLPARSTTFQPPVQERLRVLLVEDSLVTREMERRMLEDEGFHVTAVAGAKEALGRLGEESYNCMVTDFEMPEMDGLELAKSVRGIERLAQLPIIIVSTRDKPGDRLAGLEAGADAYISKQSLESHKLASIIRRLGSGG